jgi:hypothetical protein
MVEGMGYKVRYKTMDPMITYAADYLIKVWAEDRSQESDVRIQESDIRHQGLIRYDSSKKLLYPICISWSFNIWFLTPVFWHLISAS